MKITEKYLDMKSEKFKKVGDSRKVTVREKCSNRTGIALENRDIGRVKSK